MKVSFRLVGGFWPLAAILCLALFATACHIAPQVSAAGPARFEDGKSAVPTGPPVDRLPGAAPAPLHVLGIEGDTALSGTVTGTGSVKLDGAVIYFTDPFDRFYAFRAGPDAKNASLVAVLSDEAGRFETPPIFPRGTVAVANAVLARNRRLEGFAVAGKSGPIAISPGFTYVLEFIRDQAPGRGGLAPLLGSEAAQAAIFEQGARADDLIAAGKLPAPADGSRSDLAIENGAILAETYVARAFSQDEATNRAWAAVFTPRVLALENFAGNFTFRINEGGDASPSTSLGLAFPSGVAVGGPGGSEVYILNHYDRLMRVSNGYMKRFTGSLTAEATDDATPVADLKIDNGYYVFADPDG
ncbi:MAG: hypothetical protein FJZ00_14020, partial [Candidatus Sericytochromatia bacterium]|nr:hypothetical protein [Candidatus Tanganyikabacteria bacterium]